MAVPRLNVPLLLESPVRQGDGMGGHRLVWQIVGQLWAGMSSLRGSEQSGQAGAQSVVNWRIVTRAAPEGDPRRPRPDQRLRMGLRVFRIDAVAEQGGDGRFLTCFAHEEKRA
jgi:head-tail adaptor